MIAEESLGSDFDHLQVINIWRDGLADIAGCYQNTWIMFVNLPSAIAFFRLFEKGKLAIKSTLRRIMHINMVSMKKQLRGGRPYQPDPVIYTADEIADWFLAKLDTNAGDTISPLKLQKLVYYAQAWHLAVFNQPLFNEPIQAWVHGPVVPSLYQRFKDNCRDCLIDVRANGLKMAHFSTETEDLLNEVYSIYGEHSASYLEQLTHREMPWIRARKGIPLYHRSEEVITVESMIDYYKALRNGEKTS